MKQKSVFRIMALNVNRDIQNEEKLKQFWLKKLNPTLIRKSFTSLKLNVEVKLKKREDGFKAFIFA